MSKASILSVFGKIWRGLWSFLWLDKIPLWLTLALTLGGSYLIAPFINREIQRETLRRDFMVGSLEGLSADTIVLITNMNRYIAGDRSTTLAATINEEIVKLQYKMVQLNIAAPTKLSSGVEVQRALADLQQQLGNGQDVDAMRSALSVYSELSFQLYEAIVKDAGLL